MRTLAVLIVFVVLVAAKPKENEHKNSTEVEKKDDEKKDKNDSNESSKRDSDESNNEGSDEDSNNSSGEGSNGNNCGNVKDTLHQIFAPHHTECMCVTNIDSANVNKWIKDFNPVYEDACLQCHIKCLHIKSGIIELNGDYNTNQLITRGFRSEHIHACAHLVFEEVDLCKKAFLFTKCLLNKCNHSSTTVSIQLEQ